MAIKAWLQKPCYALLENMVKVFEVLGMTRKLIVVIISHSPSPTHPPTHTHTHPHPPTHTHPPTYTHTRARTHARARQILDSSKLKEFADDNLEFNENGRKFFKQVENTVGKGEIARYEQFLLFLLCFRKTCTADTQNPGIVCERVNLGDI